MPEESGEWDLDRVSMSAARSGADWTLAGTKSYVLDGTTADLILVAGRTGAGLSLFAVSGSAPGLRREPLSTMDQTRRQARLEFRVPVVVRSHTRIPSRIRAQYAFATVSAENSPSGRYQVCTELSADRMDSASSRASTSARTFPAFCAFSSRSAR